MIVGPASGSSLVGSTERGKEATKERSARKKAEAEAPRGSEAERESVLTLPLCPVPVHVRVWIEAQGGTRRKARVKARVHSTPRHSLGAPLHTRGRHC